MDICRLCLQNGADFIPNFQEIFHVLQNFLPYINSLQSLNTKVCDICLKTIQIISDLKTNLINLTNKKTAIQEEMPGIDKSNPTGVLDLVQTMNGPVKKVCKICLTVVNNPKIFLYENQFNILQHDMILYMFQFCNLKLNYDLSEKPVMCYQCWENLQVCFSFKKNYLEIDKKIRAYCNLSNISVKNISEQILREMVKHFLDHDGDIHMDMKAMIKEEIFCDDSTKRYSLRKRVKKEIGDENGDCISHVKKKISKPKIKKECTGAPRGASIPKPNSSCFTTKRNRHDFSKPNRHYFTKEDDDLLNKIYWRLKNDNNTPMKAIWKQAHVEFNKSSSLDLSLSSVTCRIRRILANKNKNSLQIQLTKLKDEELKMENVFVPLNVDQETDSDDSFLDEVKPSSFMPTIKLEPLSDDEIHIIEPKIEPLDIPPSDVDSDLESLPIPLLERMDLPPLNFQIKDIYSIEVKRETLNMITTNGDADPTSDNFNSCMRVMLSDSTNETTYKCMECHFETKYQYASKCHSDWHANSSKKRFECKHCTFVTSKFFLLKHHLSTSHEKENDEKYDSDDGIPSLVPFTI